MPTSSISSSISSLTLHHRAPVGTGAATTPSGADPSLNPNSAPAPAPGAVSLSPELSKRDGKGRAIYPKGSASYLATQQALQEQTAAAKARLGQQQPTQAFKVAAGAVGAAVVGGAAGAVSGLVSPPMAPVFTTLGALGGVALAEAGAQLVVDTPAMSEYLRCLQVEQHFEQHGTVPRAGSAPVAVAHKLAKRLPDSVALKGVVLAAAQLVNGVCLALSDKRAEPPLAAAGPTVAA